MHLSETPRGISILSPHSTEAFSCPGFDDFRLFELNKVVNEQDFLPLYFMRNLLQTLKLIRASGRHLMLTQAGRRMHDDPCGLQAALFRTAFWQVDLSAFLGRGLHGGWPQCDIGLVLWALTIAAGDWQSPEKLARLCTVPTDRMLTTEWDSASAAAEATAFRPLWWFGLLDCREEELSGASFGRKVLYRKTPLYDRLLSFDVPLNASAGLRH